MILNTNSVFFQINASLQVHSLDTVKSILNQIKTVNTVNHEQFLKIFQVIEAVLWTQNQCFSNQKQELNNFCITSNKLQTQVTDLNAYIMQLTRNSIKTHIKKQKKSLITDSEIFKSNKKKIKKNQKLFLIFITQMKLKMTENKYCFESEKKQIIYMTSRILNFVYKNIKFWILSVIKNKKDEFNKWQNILEVL